MMRVAAVCLLLSGAAGLVYQVAWMRYLALFLGHTSYAVVTVLVAFMGGLALGNAWLGRWADRIPRPLAFYAWLEFVIGVYALLFPSLYPAVEHFYLTFARGMDSNSPALWTLRFVVGLLTILLPTVLMGGTLPVLVRRVTQTLADLRPRLALLYSLNSAGAVVGCVLADFICLPGLGLEGTVLVGATLNLVAGGLAFVVSARTGEGREIAPPAPAEPPTTEPALTRPELRLVILGAGLSGFLAMLYEVVWTRMLALSMGSSTHAFALMLMTFITGIAAGAWLVSRLPRLRSSIHAFGWAEVALAATLAVSFWIYDLVPYWFSRMAVRLARTDEAYPLYVGLQALICFLVMLPPTLCLGLALPLATRAATSDRQRTGRSVGTVFAVNTLGTVLGAVLTGFWLLPALGLARTFALGIALNAALGVLVLRRHLWLARPLPALAVTALGVVLVTLAAGWWNERWQRVSVLTLWRGQPPPSYRAVRLAIDRTQLLYYRDGAGSTVSVDALTDTKGTNLILRVNGKPDASIGDDLCTQMLIGHLPLMLQPATNVLVVGLGSGVTAGAVTQHPEVRQIDVAEISPEVVQAAAVFRAHNHDVLSSPKVRLVQDDAKAFLRRAHHQYDLIISEPSNPWVAGVAGVFSLEYYEACRQRLRPEGLMVAWIQVYESTDHVLDIALNTFLAVFPHTRIWQTTGGDLVVIGSAQPAPVDLDQFERRFHSPAVQADLRTVDLLSFPVLLACEVASPNWTPCITQAGGRVHSDLFPVLEYGAQRAFFIRGEPMRHIVYDEKRLLRSDLLLQHYLRRHPFTEADYRAFALFHLSQMAPTVQSFRSLLQRWRAEHPEHLDPLEYLAQTARFAAVPDGETTRWRDALPRLKAVASTDPHLLRLAGLALFKEYADWRSVLYTPPDAELVAVFERLRETDIPNAPVYDLFLAELAWDRGDDSTCFRLASAPLGLLTDAPLPGPPVMDPELPSRVLARLIQTYYRDGRLEPAWELCRRAVAGGYAGPRARTVHPLLETICRQVARAIDAAAATPRGQI